jgi:hypothetical protein
MQASRGPIHMLVDSLDGFRHNLNVCVVADRVVWYASCPCRNKQGTTTRMQTKRLFCFCQAVLRTIAVSLHGLLGVKHRLAITPAACRPNSQRGIGQHALDQGGRQQEHGRNRWLMATLAGTSNAPCGRGWLASTPGEAMPKASGKLSSRANGGR